MPRRSQSGLPSCPTRGARLVATGLAAAVLPSAGTRAAAQFASAVNLVEVYATVSDRTGEPVTGLGPADFDVLEDGRPQAIQAFAAGDFPLSVALAIDHSASMAGSRLRTAAGAAKRFLARLRPEDQVRILAVSSDVTVLALLSRDRAAQAHAIDGLRPWSATSLNDAVIAGIDLIQSARGRRGLVILSDGEDRYSEARPQEVLGRARRADVLVYPIAVGRDVPPLFAEVAALTGGRSFHARDGKAIDRALTDIASELRTQYLLGYAPARHVSASQVAVWHRIEVRVRGSGLRVRARDGYFGP